MNSKLGDKIEVGEKWLGSMRKKRGGLTWDSYLDFGGGIVMGDLRTEVGYGNCLQKVKD